MSRSVRDPQTWRGVNTQTPPVPASRWIRSRHPYAFRSGQWGQIVSVNEKCGCYQIEWPDGATDDWAIIDPVAEYEFKEES